MLHSCSVNLSFNIILLLYLPSHITKLYISVSALNQTFNITKTDFSFIHSKFPQGDGWAKVAHFHLSKNGIWFNLPYR